MIYHKVNKVIYEIEVVDINWKVSCKIVGDNKPVRVKDSKELVILEKIYVDC